MQELDDNALLREYVERGSEEAFATLVMRHINKVYSVALRHTSNPNQAKEITQVVFITLAGKARRLNPRVILSAWLYQTARLTAVTFIRSEIRRIRREQEVYMQNASNENENESEAWKQIAPLLDAAMADLNETDRQAVVLRFFDGKSMREVGTALGANEDTARKRVNRAMEKLQRFLIKRGVISTTAILSEAISVHSVQVAPAALAKAVTAAALAQGASSSTLTLSKGALKVMAWSKAKTALVASVGILLAGGATVMVSASKAREERAKDLVAYEVLQPSWMQKVFNRPVSDEELRRQLVGVWELEAFRPPNSTNYVFFKANNKNLKIRTLTNWSIAGNEDTTDAYSAGGSYTVKNQIYTETIESATGIMAKRLHIGATPRFKIRVEGDKCYQLGLHGGFVHEVWHRVQQ